MFYALLSGKVSCEGFAFEQVLDGIETLNRLALRREIDVTAASVHACALLEDAYQIFDSGASMGDGYGPIVVACEPMTMKDLQHHEILVPGILTTAYLALRLAAGPVRHRVVAFDQIIPEMKADKGKVGLLIHEGQLTYASFGLHKVIDLGAWWKEKTGLPLPLGVNVVRSDLGADAIRAIGQALRRSIDHALDHRSEALARALEFGRGLDVTMTDRFVGMYVNDWTRSLGERGREAIERLLREGQEKGVIPERPLPRFA
jgi:1,4-dihydroxy-6-naphthoate synthase